MIPDPQARASSASSNTHPCTGRKPFALYMQHEAFDANEQVLAKGCHTEAASTARALSMSTHKAARAYFHYNLLQKKL